jgi:hypothetical protein
MVFIHQPTSFGRKLKDIAVNAPTNTITLPEDAEVVMISLYLYTGSSTVSRMLYFLHGDTTLQTTSTTTANITFKFVCVFLPPDSISTTPGVDVTSAYFNMGKIYAKAGENIRYVTANLQVGDTLGEFRVRYLTL